MESLRDAALTILKEAREGDAKDNDLALKAIDRAVKVPELSAKLKGEMTPQKAPAPQIRVNVNLSAAESRFILIHRRRPTDAERKEVEIGEATQTPLVNGKVQ